MRLIFSKQVENVKRAALGLRQASISPAVRRLISCIEGLGFEEDMILHEGCFIRATLV